jgi:DNA-binding transcriptional ArsR family regulator
MWYGTDDIDTIQASLLRTLASRHRLRIVHRLAEGEREVHELADGLGLSQAATSQHLGALRSAGLVDSTRDGRAVRYRLSDPEIGDACALMRSVLVRRLSRLGDLAAAADRRSAADPGTSDDLGTPSDPGTPAARVATAALPVGAVSERRVGITTTATPIEVRHP